MAAICLHKVAKTPWHIHKDSVVGLPRQKRCVVRAIIVCVAHLSILPEINLLLSIKERPEIPIVPMYLLFRTRYFRIEECHISYQNTFISLLTLNKIR